MADSLSDILENMGLEAENTVVATSVCSEEAVRKEFAGDITNMLEEKFGRVYKFGGLGGYPFIGKEGFNDFVGKRPDNGNVFVFFAPHIGVQNDGTIGSVVLQGQKKVTDDCLPVVTAFNYLKNTGGNATQISTKYDHQYSYIVKQLAAPVKELIDLENNRTLWKCS